MFFMLKNTSNNCDVFSTQHDLIFSLFDRDDLSKAEILTECEMNADEDSFETGSVSRRNDIHWIFATSMNYDCIFEDNILRK